MKLVLCLANSSGDKKNCLYPNRVEASSAEEMAKAVSFDHVCAEYDKNYRSISNFRKSNVVVMDCDNDHSDNPVDWITPESLDDLMPDIAYAVAPSRHNMLPKDGKSARPRFHVYFLIEETTDADYYTALKTAIHKAYPFFDGNALDAARFIFGADVDEVIWHDGWVLISEEVTLTEEEQELPTTKGPILEGNRNNTLSRFAGRVLKRYGETDKAHDIFLEEAEKCNPPLDDSELQTIWFSAIKFFRNKVSGDSGYVPPNQYNDDFGGEAGSLRPEDYSDIGQAKVLAEEYGDELLFTAATDYILQNEKYKGDALLQKTFTKDFLTHKLVVNNGEVPQYYVEGHHEGIVTADQFDQVQAEILRRKGMQKYSGVGLFSSIIKCGECGSWYGAKVWHSSDKYRKVIYRCNNKYADGCKCKTPHINEYELRELFIKAANELFSEKEEILANTKVMMEMVCETDSLDRDLQDSITELNIISEQMQIAIAENSRVALDQDEYEKRYAELTARYEKAKAGYDDIAGQIESKKAKRDLFKGFIRTLEKQDGLTHEFDAGVWSSLVQEVIVKAKDDIRFIFKNGFEVRV